MVRIILENGLVLDYESPEGLGIKLNRITDDYSQPDKRFGEFSYSFSLPKTKNNDKVWEYPDVRGRTRIFRGKQFSCKVYVDNESLFEGVIELTNIDFDSYKCVFFSSYTTLLDSLKGKKLVDMTALPTIDFEYETTVVNHINANYANADETDYQFPFCFYKTPYISGITSLGITTTAEAAMGYVYNYTPPGAVTANPVYYPKFPPAIYLNSIVKGMLTDAGWSLAGSFFQREDIKRIVILFTGDAEDFSGAIITGTTDQLDLNRILPDVSQIDFLRSVINAFNLYFVIDNAIKEISFETYNTLFGDNSNAYNITSKLDAASIVKSRPEPETKIVFQMDDNNSLVCGYGRTFDYTPTGGTANPTYWLNPNNDIRERVDDQLIGYTYKKNAFENLWNKGTGEKEIKLEFAPVNYYGYSFINTRSIQNNTNSSAYIADWTVGIPLISEQTPADFKGNFFEEDEEGVDFCSANKVSEMKYEGDGIRMAYYYGRANYDLAVGAQKYRDFTWIAVATGGTCENPTFARVRVPIASPFKLMTSTEKDLLFDRLDLNSVARHPERYTEVGAEWHGLLLTYYSVATTGSSYAPTEFTLTMGDSPDFLSHNLYSYFHLSKYEALRNGYLLKADMVMNQRDWKEMQIYRPLLYNGEYFQLVSIKNFDPVKRTSEITLLRKQ